MDRRQKFLGTWIGGGSLLLALLFALSGCLSNRIRPPRGVRPYTDVYEVTGYCNCGKCCNWERSWFGLGPPVVSKGVNRGARKIVGQTASGVRAHYGTVAADTAVLPFGTVIEIPGYGYGRVEDRGGAIRGKRLDLWFPSHEAALRWGRKRIRVRIWK